MRLLGKQREIKMGRRETLAGIPLLRQDVNLEQDGDGSVTIRMKKARGNRLFDMFRPPIVSQKYELDEFGTFVIRQIEQKVSIMDIINAFQRHFRMSRRDSELGVVAFIKMLLQRQVVDVVPASEMSHV